MTIGPWFLFMLHTGIYVLNLIFFNRTPQQPVTIFRHFHVLETWRGRDREIISVIFANSIGPCGASGSEPHPAPCPAEKPACACQLTTPQVHAQEKASLTFGLLVMFLILYFVFMYCSG